MVHAFKLHDLHLALDVNTGAVHVTDEPAYLAIVLLTSGLDGEEAKRRVSAQFGQAVAETVFAEIERLTGEGLLFSAPKKVEAGHDGTIKALCLHLAHDCNLRCRYCFAGTGGYGGPRGLMPAETARAAIDFLLRESRRRRHCEVDFFGGEPTLNFEVLKSTVRYGREQAAKLGKIIKFTVTTNAYNLTDEMIDFLNEEQISVVLSLDGRRDVHDRMRKTPGGRGSYHKVLANCKKLVASRNGDNYYLRGTYTRHNPDFSRDIISMVEEGFDRISMEPAVLAPDNADALSELDLPQLFAEYEQLADVLWKMEEKGRRITFFHFELDLLQGPCAKKRAQGCGAGASYLAVAPDGSLYPCHQFVGDSRFRAGDVESGIVPEKLLPFQKLAVTENEECNACFARFFCGGGCHAAAWLMNGDLDRPYRLGCELQRKRVECGLYLQAKRLLADQAGVM